MFFTPAPIKLAPALPDSKLGISLLYPATIVEKLSPRLLSKPPPIKENLPLILLFPPPTIEDANPLSPTWDPVIKLLYPPPINVASSPAVELISKFV